MKPMANAKLRYNPDKSLCEIQIGDSEDDTWGPLHASESASESGYVLLDDESGDAYYFSLTDDEGLSPETVYRLEPLATEIEEDVEMEDEDEEEEEETEANGV